MNTATRHKRAVLRDRRRTRTLRTAAWSSPITRSAFGTASPFEALAGVQVKDTVPFDFRAGGFADFLYRQYPPVPPRPVFTDQEWAEGAP